MPDWVETLRQTSRHWPDVFRHLRPTHSLRSVTEIDPAFLARHGIEGLAWDVDGTLTSYHGPAVDPSVRPALERLLNTDVRHVILSNCDEVRFQELGRIFFDVPVLRAYATATGFVFRQLWRGEETWEGGTREAVAGGRPLRKPNATLAAFAARVLAVPPARAAMVGDQYSTDVAGANLAGLQSIKVPTLQRQTFPATLRWFQRLEALAQRFAPPAPAAVPAGPARDLH